MDIIVEPVIALFSDLWDPKKRIFLGYLVLASLFAAVVLRLKYPKSFSFQFFMSTLFTKKVWLSDSSFADLKLLLFNRVLFGGIVTQVLSKSTVGLSVYFLLLDTGWVSATATSAT